MKLKVILPVLLLLLCSNLQADVQVVVTPPAGGGAYDPNYCQWDDGLQAYVCNYPNQMQYFYYQDGTYFYPGDDGYGWWGNGSRWWRGYGRWGRYGWHGGWHGWHGGGWHGGGWHGGGHGGWHGGGHGGWHGGGHGGGGHGGHH